MLGELAALGAAVCWTVSAILYKEALKNTRPVSANIVRLATTGGILMALLIAAGKIGVLASLPVNIALFACASGIIGLGLGDTLYMMSLDQIGVGRAVPITCTYPLFSILWAILFGQGPVTVQAVLGAVAIFIGIWLLSQGQAMHNVQTERKNAIKGIALSLATAILWSVSISMIGIAVEEAPNFDYALAINAVRLAAIAVSILLIAPVIDRSHGFLKIHRKTLIMLISGGIVALALGWFLLTYSFINTAVSQAVPISSTTPLFSTLAAILFLREKVTVRNVLGSILVVIGIFVIFLV